VYFILRDLYIVIIKKILILNLFKTIVGMKSGLACVTGAVGSGSPVWFINLEQASRVIVKYLATLCGEFSATSY